MIPLVFAVACLVFVYAVYDLTHGTATFGTGLCLLFVIMVCEKILKRRVP